MARARWLEGNQRRRQISTPVPPTLTSHPTHPPPCMGSRAGPHPCSRLYLSLHPSQLSPAPDSSRFPNRHSAGSATAPCPCFSAQPTDAPPHTCAHAPPPLQVQPRHHAPVQPLQELLLLLGLRCLCLLLRQPPSLHPTTPAAGKCARRLLGGRAGGRAWRAGLAGLAHCLPCPAGWQASRRVDLAGHRMPLCPASPLLLSLTRAHPQRPPPPPAHTTLAPCAHPDHPSVNSPPALQTIYALAFALLCQLANWRCHLILSRLRPNPPAAGGKDAGAKLAAATAYSIPRGFLFNYITCANYTAEILGWVAFTVATQVSHQHGVLPAWRAAPTFHPTPPKVQSPGSSNLHAGGRCPDGAVGRGQAPAPAEGL